MNTNWSRRGILTLALAIFGVSLLYLSSTRYYGTRTVTVGDEDAGVHRGFAERPAGEERPPPPPPAAATTRRPTEATEYVPTGEAAVDELHAETSVVRTKGVVIGRKTVDEFGGGTEWVHELDDWRHYIYIVDLPEGVTSSTGYRTKMNRAHEAMPYLTFIVEHYDNLPDIVAFVHPHRGGPGAQASAWHTDAPKNDAVTMLRTLRTETVMKQGYVNLRCIDKLPGCPDEIQPWRDPPDIEKTAEHVFPYYYAGLFNVTLAQVREQASVVAQPCCAQFAVSKEQILVRPRGEYEHFIRFLENTVQDGHEDETAGRVMEYMWHIIFGREAVFCPKAIQCYCDVYGRMCPRT